MTKQVFKLFLILCILSFFLAFCQSKKKLSKTSPKFEDYQAFGLHHLGPFGAPIPLSDSLEWTPSGSGRYMCSWVSSLNYNEILIGCATSGLYKTIDGGKSWTQKLNFAFSTGIKSIINLENENHILACATTELGNFREYSFGLIESFDNGETWQRNSLQFEPSEYNLTLTQDVKLLDKNLQKVICITNHDIYLSNDNAKSWKKVFNTEFELKKIEVNPQNSNQILVSGNGLYYSSDGGENWTEILDKVVNNRKEKVNKYSNCAVVFSKINKNSFYINANLSKNYLFKCHLDSLDNPILMGFDLTRHNIHRNQFSIYSDDENKDVLLIGNVRLNEIKFPYNNSKTITDPAWKSNNFTHDDINHISIKNKIIYISTDGGVDKSVDYGKTWQSITFFSNISSALMFGFDKNKSKIILAGNQDMGVYSYQFKDRIWNCLKIYGDGGRCVATNDSQGFYFGIAKLAYLTNDNGKNFNIKNSGLCTNFFEFRMDYDNENEIFYLANYQLYSFKNKEKHKILTLKHSPDRPIKALFVNPLNPNEIWYARDDATWGNELKNKLWLSEDAGETWTDKSNNCSVLLWKSINDIYKNQNDVLALAMNGFDSKNGELQRVFMSYDNGETFVNVSNGLGNFPVNTICYANGKWICGNNNNVYVLNETENKWELLSNNFPSTIVSEIKYFEQENALYISTFGKGLFRYNY